MDIDIDIDIGIGIERAIDIVMDIVIAIGIDIGTDIWYRNRYCSMVISWDLSNKQREIHGSYRWSVIALGWGGESWSHDPSMETHSSGIMIFVYIRINSIDMESKQKTIIGEWSHDYPITIQLITVSTTTDYSQLWMIFNCQKKITASRGSIETINFTFAPIQKPTQSNVTDEAWKDLGLQSRKIRPSVGLPASLVKS